MTAVTVDFYVGGQMAERIYLDHNEVTSGTLDGLIEEARLTSITGKDKDGTLPSILVSVYISWHEHDVCDIPDCNGEEPVVPTYEFIQGADPKQSKRKELGEWAKDKVVSDWINDEQRRLTNTALTLENYPGKKYPEKIPPKRKWIPRAS